MASNLTETNGSTTKKETAKAAGAARPPAPRKDGTVFKTRRYLHEVVVELKKTTWPTRGELIGNTKLTIGLVAVVGIYIFVIDWLLTRLTAALGFWK
jgi:preprotein translocase subunit SecE